MEFTRDQILGMQLAFTEELWRTFHRNGVHEGMELDLDFYYEAPNKAAARAIAAGLTDYEAHVRSRGILFWKSWYVKGSTGPMAVDGDILKDWTVAMVDRGLAHDCLFDGFGAYVPESVVEAREEVPWTA